MPNRLKNDVTTTSILLNNDVVINIRPVAALPSGRTRIIGTTTTKKEAASKDIVMQVTVCIGIDIKTHRVLAVYRAHQLTKHTNEHHKQ